MLKLQSTDEYNEWIGSELENGGELVIEREIHIPIEGYPSPIISIVKRGDRYKVFRTFQMNSNDSAVSVDMSNVTAEEVFQALLTNYSQLKN